MQFVNPNQAKIVTTPFAPDETPVLSAQEAELLFGGGTTFKVSQPGPLQGEWVVVKVNPKSIKITSLVGPDGRPAGSSASMGLTDASYSALPRRRLHPRWRV